MSQPKIRNPYQGMFVGHFAQKLEEMQQYSPEELVLANFTVIQTLLAWEASSQREFDGEKRTVLAALEVLEEQEQISAEFKQFCQMLLRGWTLERLTSIATQAQSLPLTAARLRADGDLAVQVRILQEFLVTTLSIVDNREVKAYGMQTIQRLKLESGLSQESLDRMLELVAAGASEEDEDGEPDEAGEDEERDFDAVDEADGTDEPEDYWIDDDDSQEDEP